MNLWYIAIDLDRDVFSDEYRYEFTLYTRFISNYLSKRIRKARFKTDGTFNMISIRLAPRKIDECRLMPIDVLRIDLGFDRNKYEKIKGTTDYGYYLEMLEKGFRKASEFKEIPLQELLDLMEEFRKNGYKNEWLHKKKRFKELDIEVALNCYFTTSDFKLVATIKKMSTKEELCSGVVLRTDPDEVCFDYMFKDILIDKKNIIITDLFDHPRMLIDLRKALNRKFVSEVIPEDID